MKGGRPNLHSFPARLIASITKLQAVPNPLGLFMTAKKLVSASVTYILPSIPNCKAEYLSSGPTVIPDACILAKSGKDISYCLTIPVPIPANVQ
ncbi:hypothetical protein D3C87_538760 [compost metagenome]